MEEYPYANRDHLGNGKKKKKNIDMDEVYMLLDSGLTIKQVARKKNISVATLYRHHKIYQEQAARLERKRNIFRDFD